MTRTRIYRSLLLLASFIPFVQCFSAEFSLFDRFRATCPADVGSIRQFDASLATTEDPDETWCAVYRSNNNKPSVIVKDELFNAMRIATGEVSTTVLTSSSSSASIESPLAQETPVAVARLRPSTDFEATWVLDCMRCWLKKEDTNPACDGGSEHAEAISVAIDSLLLHHLELKPSRPFHGAIRTKATLVSGTLLEQRGFVPVQTLQKDMATHLSSLDECLEKYAERAVSTSAKNPGSRQVALQILAELGRLDREAELEASERKEQDIQDDDEIDPWAGMKKFL